MIVNRTVWINPVEPHPMSFRTANGIDTKLNVAFIAQDGSPYDSDLAAQLQLTGRTSERAQTYLMPATDIANGKARATIPAGALTDPNGYRLRMLGTLRGETALLAVGHVAPVFSSGLDTIPVDVIDTIPLTFEYNEAVELDVSLWQDASKGTELDLSAEATTVSANVLDSRGGTAIAPFTVTVVDSNTVTLSLTVDQVNALPPSCWWTLVGSTSAGATTLAEGAVTVTGTIIPTLPETVASYDYQKPATLDNNPAAGQIFHNTITQNILKVAKLAQASLDLTTTLALVRAGDEIVIGATTWTVGLTYEASEHFEFKVQPVAQDAISGVTPVTFRRPAA